MDAIHAQTGLLAYPRILPSRRIEKIVERYSLKRADLVVGANRDNLEYAIANGAARDRTSVFRYGNLVAADHFTDPSERVGGREMLIELGIDPARPILLYIGRLEPVKHVLDLIEVAHAVHKHEPHIQLLVIGDGSERPHMEDRTVALSIAQCVHLPGDLDQTQIAKVVPHVQVIVATHMGRALVEAALGAVPVVAYDHDWHAELVDDGVHGHLVPLRDTEAMAAKVLSVLDNPQSSSQMGIALRQKALEMMNPERLTAHERSTYARLLGQA